MPVLIPPFCPNPNCVFHNPDHPRFPGCSGCRRWYSQDGSYHTASRGIVRRFRCRACDASCSEQTFRLDYYVKRRISYRRIEQGITSCCGVRALGRSLGCSPGSVSNRVSRLARQYIAAHERILAAVSLREPLAADGFQSFAVSQYYPNNIHLLTGCDSQFLYFIDYVTIRRAGTMTKRQKRLRRALEQVYRADPGGIRRSFANLAAAIAKLADRSTLPCITLWTDKKTAYREALSGIPAIRQRIIDHTFEHPTVSSRRARDVHNPLFPVNYMDREFRKGLAEHVRESTRFARNVNNSMERLWVYLGVHNYRKQFRLNTPIAERRFHAIEAGIDRQRIDEALSNLYARRRFLTRESVRGCARNLWLRRYSTPLRGEDPQLLAKVRRLGAQGEINVQELRRQMGISKSSYPKREYVPAYAFS